MGRLNREAMNEQSNGMPLDKAALRKAITMLRDGIPLEERIIRSEAACRHLAAWMTEHGVTSFMCYVPFRSELNTRSLIEWGWKTGAEVIVPKCDPANRSMTLHKLDSWSSLKAGAYGILEPDPDRCPALPDSYVPGLVAAPGIAFDRKGGRLGYGGGYYDRYAERLGRDRADVAWLGIAFEDQLVDDIPMQAHDRRMDGIVTELSARVWGDG